ncbi:hypothetical protein LWI28_018080 [Acer negundo]|uniref:Guided entry of tail-anchored proteins factor 1 n=1 Tax=Acer negundo TaxID=4023 RepID=A0AAD5I795_ACENE|nr:hypothetical protein LWI28_018080 [Acer negundo]KAK4833314.1 hypothetical protein QYF36_002623 [Acer negundo]
MREEGALVEQRSSIAAPFIFFIVLTFHLVSKFLDQSKRKGSASDREMQLRGEIKQLLKDASTMSQPSTFAQAAKLRRLAAAKEKELATYQESQNKEMKLSYDMSLKFLLLAKVFIYFVLIIWFWRAPVATISQQLVQPFGKFLSWSARSPLNNNVMVGIIPWLILSTRVSRFVSGLFKWRI